MTLLFFSDKINIVIVMNGILVINKEKGMTSRDVVNIACKKLGTRHIGHTGTLDPIATGVLVLGVNDGCKIIELLTSNRKTYIAEILMGVETDTLDTTGNIIKEESVNITQEEIEKVINSFPKKYEQVVPIYSAVHVDGKRLYEYARSGEEVELPKREVEIYDLKLLEVNGNTFKIEADVSKGTYIRSLIRDIGKMLNISCSMQELKRIKQGIFTLDDAYNLESIDNNTKLISIKDALSNIDSINVPDDIAKKVSNGMILELDTNADLVCVLNNDKLLAIYKRYDKDITKMKPLKVFKEEL